MQVGAVVIPYRQVTAGVVSSVPGSGSLRNLPSAWTQPLNGPIGDPARKRTFRLREKLAGILSKDSRHVLLPSPHDRYGDAREHNAKSSGKQQEIHHLHPHLRPAVMIYAICRGAWPVRVRTLRLKLPNYSRLFPRGFCIGHNSLPVYGRAAKAGDPQAAIYLGETYDLAFLKRARCLWAFAGDCQRARSSVIHNRSVYYPQLPERFLSKPERSG
jgi:hypothetical protein